MSITSSNAMQPAISGASGGVARRLGIWTLALMNHLERRAAVKTLRELDDRALRDIGLVRSQIEDAVAGSTFPDLGRLR